jgi:hypothetical protein
MDALERLRATIDGFPGYDGDLERRRSDGYVRSYLGEALANLAAQNVLTPDLQQRVADLILRVGFADPRAFANRHLLASPNGTNDGGAVGEADAATVDLADRAATIDADSAAAYLDEVVATLDRRDAAIRAAAAQMS